MLIISSMQAVSFTSNEACEKVTTGIISSRKEIFFLIQFNFFPETYYIFKILLFYQSTCYLEWISPLYNSYKTVDVYTIGKLIKPLYGLVFSRICRIVSGLKTHFSVHVINSQADPVTAAIQAVIHVKFMVDRVRVDCQQSVPCQQILGGRLVEAGFQLVIDFNNFTNPASVTMMAINSTDLSIDGGLNWPVRLMV